MKRSRSTTFHSVVVGPWPTQSGRVLDEGFKIGDVPTVDAAEAQLTAVAIPLRVGAFRSNPCWRQTEACGGVRRFGPHGCDVDLPAEKVRLYGTLSTPVLVVLTPRFAGLAACSTLSEAAVSDGRFKGSTIGCGQHEEHQHRSCPPLQHHAGGNERCVWARASEDTSLCEVGTLDMKGCYDCIVKTKHDLKSGRGFKSRHLHVLIMTPVRDLDGRQAQEIEEQLFTTHRQQLPRHVPIPLPRQDFWEMVRALLSSLDLEIQDMVRKGSIDMRLQNLQKRQTNIRRIASELARKRMVAMMQHAASQSLRSGVNPNMAQELPLA